MFGLSQYVVPFSGWVIDLLLGRTVVLLACPVITGWTFGFCFLDVTCNAAVKGPAQMPV